MAIHVWVWSNQSDLIRHWLSDWICQTKVVLCLWERFFLFSLGYFKFSSILPDLIGWLKCSRHFASLVLNKALFTTSSLAHSTTIHFESMLFHNRIFFHCEKSEFFYPEEALATESPDDVKKPRRTMAGVSERERKVEEIAKKQSSVGGLCKCMLHLRLSLKPFSGSYLEHAFIRSFTFSSTIARVE